MRMRGGMQRGGGIFSFFNSNLKPKNLVDKKTPADIFRMKQPIMIEDDFFEKYKDELDTLAIPTEIREALQMMMDLKNKETVFNTCYAGKGIGPKVHFKTPMPAPAPFDRSCGAGCVARAGLLLLSLAATSALLWTSRRKNFEVALTGNANQRSLLVAEGNKTPILIQF